MSHIFPSLPTTFGVYTVTRLLGSHASYERYIAKQSHVDRSVVLEVVRPNMPQEVLDAFLENARARVTEKLPQVSQVLETTSTQGLWYTTLECPEGTPLSRFREQGKRLSSRQACSVVEQVGRLYDLFARKDIAAGNLTDDAVFIKGKDEVSVLSPVISGTHSAVLVPVQQDSLASVVRPVRPVGTSGETRINTLLDWLEQGFEGQRIDWQTISATAEYVREQVSPIISQKNIAVLGADAASANQRRAKMRSGNRKRLAVMGGIALLSVIIMTCTGFFIGPMLKLGKQMPIHDGYAICRTADGKTVAVMEGLVSIKAYNDFLQDYTGIDTSQGLRLKVNKGLPDPNDPHTPLHWAEQWKAAVEGKSWNGEKLTLDSPVTGVSLWDAMAYANYVEGELPEYNVLHTAREAIGEDACEEWTTSTRPADGIYEKAHILNPAGRKDTPVLESDPAARKEGRGFRVMYPTIPQSPRSSS